MSCSDEFFGFVDGCSTTTAADGGYQLGGFLPEGSYVIRFRAADGFHATEWYDDAPTSQQATPVPVVPGLWSEGVDAALEPAGGISGTVTNEGGGALLANLDHRLPMDRNRVGSSRPARMSSTTPTMSLLGLPEGTYRVKFRGGPIFNPNFGVEEYYDDVLTLDEATDVVVTIGSVTPGIGGMLGNLDGGESAIANPSFDDDLDGWSTEFSDGSSVHHGGVDVAGSALSGSVEVVSVGGVSTASVDQCVAIDGGSGLRFGAWSRASGASAGSPDASVLLEFFADAECSGGVIGTASVRGRHRGARLAAGLRCRQRSVGDGGDSSCTDAAELRGGGVHRPLGRGLCRWRCRCRLRRWFRNRSCPGMERGLAVTRAERQTPIRSMVRHGS